MMALCYEEDDEREYYEFEPLPTLLEDEENVSLADILSLRDSCLTEQDIWAACRECCHSMKSISHTPLFHTLCITPDTLAFNANGNVCFMEQLSDDPEGAFVPPEFDITGNTFEAHVYSLGATLAAAAEYVIEPELEPNLSEELRSLLDQMQREKPEERPDIEGILNTCEEKLKCSSSDIICRNLSAIGRRVLSIESVGALQDGCEETYKEKKRQEGVGHELQTSERNPADGSSSTEDLPYDLNVLNNGTTDVICKAEKCVRDVDPDSIFEADKIFQPSSDSMASVEICERREAVLTIGPEETTVDVKIKGHEADRISPVPQKRSTARKRMLPKLPTEMVGSAQHLHRSKMELSRSSMSNLSPVSFSDTAAGSLSSLDSTNLLSVTDCRQKVQFRTKNNDFTFIPKCSLPSEISNMNNSSEWAQKVSNTEVVNKNLPNSRNLNFDENRERSLKSPFTLGKMSSTKSLKAKIAAAKFTSADMNSQMDLRSSSGILFETGAVVGGCSINTPGAEGNDYLSCMDSNLSEAERTVSSHQWNYFKQSRCQSVNDLSKSNSLLFSNVTQLCQDDNSEQLPTTSATENKHAEFSFDSQYISLEELLSEDDRPLKDHELWALCYECLISLQLCKDYPEYLCLESAYIDTSGEVLFLSPTNNGNLDSFYLAPEFEKQGAVTEKACIYGIAAILWAAAKFNAPVNQKLPLSRNLKNLLLDMAKRNSTERPSITDAMEICNNYLIKRGICSREILILLRNSVIQNYQKQGMDVIRLNCKTEVLEFAHSPLGNTDFAQESSGTGFVPLASDSKLTAVKGPIPCQYSVNSKSPSKLPEAFTSPATHFKPIILTQHKEKTSSVKVSSKNPTTKQLVKAMKDKNQGAAPIEDIKSNAVVKASAVNFESFESSTRPSATLVTSPVQTKISSISSVNHSTVAGSKTNPSQTISSQHQKINCDSGSSAISTFPINNEHLLQNSKTRIRTSPTAQLTVPEQATVMPSTPGCELNRHSPEPMILSEMHCSRISEISLNSIRSQLQNPSNPTLDGYENQTPNMKMYTLSESPNSSFKEFVDFDSVASVISLSETCYFAQEILDTGNEIKPLTAVANITAEVSENVHLPSACISSCCHDNLMAITSSSPAPISLLQKAVHLIKEEFAFDGYLENGEEAHAMGEYILSLKSLKFSTFNSAISEKFYDLYWDDKLLEQLYEVVNGNPPPPAPLPEATTRPNPDYFNPTLQNTMKKKKTVPGHGKQRSSDDNWEKAVDLEAREISRKPHLSSTALSERIVLDVNCLSDNLYSAKCKEDQLLSNVKMILGQDTRNMVPDDTDFKQPKSDNCEEEEKVAKHFYQMEDSCNFTGEGCNPSQDLKLNPSNEEKKEGTDQTTEGSESLVSESLRHMESNIGKKRCNPGWSSAFFGIEYFNQQVKTCVKQLGQHNFNEGDKIETKLLELEQQLNMETKNFRKTKVFYQKLQLQEKRNKGVDAKVVLPKLKQQLEEMRQKVEFLELAKKYLEILQMEQWGLRPSVLLSLVSLSFQSETLDLTSTDSNSHLTFHTLKGDQSQSKKGTQVLQAGTAVGLMAYLYSSNAVKDGYVQQFFYTFRYFTSPCEFLQFLEDRINSVIDISVTKKCTADCTKVYNRSLDLLQAWIEECYNVDFAQDTEVLHKLKTFISSKAMQLDSRGQYLINLLHNFSEKKKTCTDVSFSLEDMKNEEDNQSVHSLSKKVLDGDISRKSFKWKISKRTEPSSPHQKEKYYNTATALPKSCSNSFATELSGAYQKVDEKGLFMLADYSPQHIAQQLTLLQQELFQDCHPVHFLNSRAFGVKDKPITVRKSASSEISFIEGSSLFVPECKHQYLLDLIRYADNVSHWVSAEIVTCDTPKAQHAQLSKFLSIAKICYELRNFATAMQILSSLGSLIVRQLPSWKSLSSKALEITEELTAVQVFLKSDSLCLMEGDSFSKQPTMPCAHILAMHVQQLEIGAFTMANGTYKWPKLRKIAMVVSQIRAFQEKPYVFTPDLDLQAHLRQQITNFSEVDIHVLAAENKTNFYQSSTEWHSRKIQDALRKVKATFQ
ncbi:kinase non-catalytic C-lobe domain-containing protein 1 isoform X1 [Scyliorhinus canicula]|uniref:kinase non-catalytic C-lobe domain-containing protein 1 isoform X1 n=2 Tax=Scyliorhinus canicula TaxID=7830 RepID=UPI0018F32E87|nr:kinase non-catalytic C-lobe domain-containing protein 1 isoform X1 [Scyliorhinus canicula]